MDTDEYFQSNGETVIQRRCCGMEAWNKLSWCRSNLWRVQVRSTVRGFEEWWEWWLLSDQYISGIVHLQTKCDVKRIWTWWWGYWYYSSILYRGSGWKRDRFRQQNRSEEIVQEFRDDHIRVWGCAGTEGRRCVSGGHGKGWCLCGTACALSIVSRRISGKYRNVHMAAALLWNEWLRINIPRSKLWVCSRSYA